MPSNGVILIHVSFIPLKTSHIYVAHVKRVVDIYNQFTWLLVSRTFGTLGQAQRETSETNKSPHRCAGRLIFVGPPSILDVQSSKVLLHQGICNVGCRYNPSNQCPRQQQSRSASERSREHWRWHRYCGNYVLESAQHQIRACHPGYIPKRFRVFESNPEKGVGYLTLKVCWIRVC